MFLLFMSDHGDGADERKGKDSGLNACPTRSSTPEYMWRCAASVHGGWRWQCEQEAKVVAVGWGGGGGWIHVAWCSCLFSLFLSWSRILVGMLSFICHLAAGVSS